MLLKGDSTPGVPWCTLGSTNSVIAVDEAKSELLENAVLLRLVDMLEAGENIFEMGAEELVRRNICSPIRLFIKDEPHKESKRAAGKLRLISGMAVDDQILDRLIFGLQNNFEIDSWWRIPSKPGLGLDDSGLRILSANFEELLTRGPLQGTDVSGWDWSVQPWEIDVDCRTRIRLAGVERGHMLEFLMRVRHHCAARKVFVLPDGTLVAQQYPGVQPSGWYCTSSTNSRMRIAARLAVMGPWADRAADIVTMGDDAVEGALGEGALRRYEELGHIVKGASVFHEVAGIEFCSHEFMSSGLAFPANPVKTLYRFFSHPPTSTSYLDWFSQLRNDLRNLPEGDNYFRVALAHAEWAKENNGEEEQSSSASASGSGPRQQ
jgi:hypothetical protein